MANPWVKKNPFLSMFLSSANAVAGRARGTAVAQAKRSHASATKHATQTWIDAWTPDSGKKRKRRR